MSPVLASDPLLVGFITMQEDKSHLADFRITGSSFTIGSEFPWSLPERIELIPTESGKNREFRMEQQFETSVWVKYEEGHPWVLQNWKHYVSEWKSMEKIDLFLFGLKEEESTQFLDVNHAEIIAAYKRELKRFEEKYPALENNVKLSLSRLADCKTLDNEACGVFITTYRCKVSVKDGSKWKVIQIIEMPAHVGC